MRGKQVGSILRGAAALLLIASVVFAADEPGRFRFQVPEATPLRPERAPLKAFGPVATDAGEVKPAAELKPVDSEARPAGPELKMAGPDLTAPAPLKPPSLGAPASAPAESAGPTLAPPRQNALREGPRLEGTGLRAPITQPEQKTPAPAAGPSLGTDISEPPPHGDTAPKVVDPPAKLTPPAAASPTAPSEPPKERLQPVPAPSDGPVEIEAASFSGITPGASTVEEVEKAWGKPKQVKDQNEMAVHLYQVEPFDRVEAVFSKGKVVSIIIRLEKSFPADAVARQLEISNIRPVLISDDLGHILGQSYPERGVVLSFEPSETVGKATMQVTQIVLEPINAEPFVLRAETNMDVRLEASLRDLDQALKLSPNIARAHWLRARLLAIQGDPTKAAAAADDAVRLEPKDPQYRVTRAQILGQLGRYAEAIAEAERAVANAGSRPHVKARAQCLLGDLLSAGPQPDYKRAIEQHNEAIKTADALTTSPHPAIRLPAKEVLVDAHLGAAHDIAWGNWNQKQTAVAAWLKRASGFADDLIKNEGGTLELRFRVATRALAACVGAQGKIDPSEWTEQVIRVGEELADSAGTPGAKQQIRWDLGLALYDAVQVYQMREQRDLAVKYGKKAIECLEQGAPSKPEAGQDRYLLGRLYFRMGSIQAIGEKDHGAAVIWFDKALPALEKSAPQVGAAERGRLGETMVSMAVSYWETGQRERAVKLTQQGVAYIEQAVQGGVMPSGSLEVPQSNLATMRRSLGQFSPNGDKIEQARKPGGAQR